ncbi:MAG: hypothetical protein E7358_04375 [Clostridiales bacterium]|nr:hypothetical protein [Clostridiales bacterium]
MFEVFKATLAPMLILLVCIIIGFILRKTKVLPDGSDKVLSKLLTFSLAPALSFMAFAKYCTVDAIKEKWVYLLYSLLAIAVALPLAILLAKVFIRKKEYKRSVYEYALMFGNLGYVGDPVVLMLFGAEGLFNYKLFTLPMSFLIYVWGITILTPKENRKGSPIKNLFNVPMIAMFVGIIFGLTGLTKVAPSFIMDTAEKLGNCMGPIAMVLTGFVIAGYNFKDILSDKKVYLATGYRLFIIPSIIILILFLTKAPVYMMGLALIAYATPLGMNTVVFPAAFGGETKTGASMALISHTLCVISIPVMYALFTLIFM